MINFKQGRWSIACVCMVLGFMLAVQFRATEDMRQSVSQQRVEELAARLIETEKERDRLQEELKGAKEQPDGLSAHEGRLHAAGRSGGHGDARRQQGDIEGR